MCDSAECNWVWTLRDRKTGRPVQSSDGYTYYFTEEGEAHTLAQRLADRDLELIQIREPGL